MCKLTDGAWDWSVSSTCTATQYCDEVKLECVEKGNFCSQCKANPAAGLNNIQCKSRVSALDISTWISEFNFLTSQVKTDWKSDMNCDGKINVEDLSIIISKITL